MPIKSRNYVGLCFRPEDSIENISCVKDFINGVIQNFSVTVKKEPEEECDLKCEEEAHASESEIVLSGSAQTKKIFAYSSEYRELENSIYENLIISMQKLV